MYMFTNYQKRFSITSYEDITFNSVTGFEQVVTYGIPTGRMVEVMVEILRVQRV